MNASSSRAFSLIEVLVVIAITAILAILAFTASDSLVSRSHDARCASNLRQLYQAFMAYAQDYGGKVPFGVREPDVTNINANYYGGQYGKELKAYLPGKQGHNTGYVEPYLCPLDRENRGGGRGFFGHSYGVNMTICRDNYNRVSTWRNASRVFLLTDSLKDVIARSSPNTNLAFRHKEGANTLFLDGHVECLKGPFPDWTTKRSFWVPDYE